MVEPKGKATAGRNSMRVDFSVSIAEGTDTCEETVQAGSANAELRVKLKSFIIFTIVQILFYFYNSRLPTLTLQNNPKDDLKVISVIGRLKKQINYWGKIGTNETVKEIIREGYKIPLLFTPLNSYFENNRSAL